MQLRFLTTVLCLALALVLALTLTLAVPVRANADTTAYEQRALYRTALDHLTAGRMSAYRQARQQLDGYVLLPYLDYYELQTRLSTLGDAEIRQFRERHSDLPVTGILYQRWLRHLGTRREWSRYLANYEPGHDTELQCLQLRALHATGNARQAFDGVEALWVVGRSQPKACDPIFDAWINAEELTEGQVWERLQLALADNQRTLGRYLLRFFNGPLKGWAEALYNVHTTPATLTRSGRLDEDNAYSRVVLAHGLIRLAATDADAARAAWQRFQDSHRFDAEQTRRINETIWLARARNGTFPDHLPADTGADFRSAIAMSAVTAQRWPIALQWIEHLPADVLSENRWQYWLGRSLSETYAESERARLTFRALAQERDYYGFLAAERLGLPMRLNGEAATVDRVTIDALRGNPAVARALELFAVGDSLNARREWYSVLPRLERTDQVALAHLALQMGWSTHAIHTANNAELRDHLDLRFPVLYPALFQRVSHTTTIPQPFLLAIARQESAFDPQARSSANARGLMQLLPTTAVEAARRAGLTQPAVRDLFDPDTNVTLGGHHMAELLGRYGDRRPLAAAAYNAGQSRVDRWIRGRSGEPMDVWIERIPFTETRNYVKNVLAFTQVYGTLLEMPSPMLAPHETAIP